jgi:hypothetical protein
MAPVYDSVNLVWRTVAAASALLNRSLFDYGILMIFPIVYQFIRCRNLYIAKEHLARLNKV